MTRISKRLSALSQLVASGGQTLPAWAAKELTRPERKKPRQLEQSLQIMLCQYLNTVPGTLYWHTPSSMYVGAPDGRKLGYLNKLKRMGWKRGIADLCIAFRSVNGAATMCFAEVKHGSGKLTDEQQGLFDQLNGLGFYTSRVASLEDLQMLLRFAGHPAFK